MQWINLHVRFFFDMSEPFVMKCTIRRALKSSWRWKDFIKEILKNSRNKSSKSRNESKPPTRQESIDLHENTLQNYLDTGGYRSQIASNLVFP